MRYIKYGLLGALPFALLAFIIGVSGIIYFPASIGRIGGGMLCAFLGFMLGLVSGAVFAAGKRNSG